MSHRKNITLYSVILFFIILIIRFFDPVPVQFLRSSLFDLYQRIEPRQPEMLPISIIDIDERSLSELGQWPWPRSMIANLTDKLSQTQPLVIGFDMIFPEPDRLSPSNFANLFDQHIDTNFLANLKQIDNDNLFATVLAQTPSVLGVMLNNSIAQTKSMSQTKANIIWNKNPLEYLPSISSKTTNLPIFEEVIQGIGVLTLLPEVDGVVRKVPTLYRVDDEIWPSFGMELLRTALGADVININVDEAGIDSVETGGIVISTTTEGSTWVHFNRHQGTRFISAVDILQEKVDFDSLAGHIFLIGTSASGLLDIKMTPMAQQMPGVEIWTQWLESALFGELLERPNYAVAGEMLFLLFSGFLLILLTINASARVSLAVYLSLTIACLVFSWWMYTNKLLFDASFPVISIGVLFAWLMLMKFWQEEQQRKQIKNAFSHYLSPAIVDALATDPNQLKLGGESREITSLFTDLQGFTELSEVVEPENLVALINRYLDGICQIVINEGGTIDKIVGDAIHAMFGAPQKDHDHADKAVSCALKIDEFCQQFRDNNNNSNGFKFGNTRIGVNSGMAVVGNFGGEQRFDYTAYGDTVNTAARLESANQYIGTTICVADSTKKSCASHHFRPVADITVKGRSESIMVYEPVTENSKVYSYLNRYQDVFAELQNQVATAINQLQELHDEFPDDTVVKMLLNDARQSNVTGVKKVLSEK